MLATQIHVTALNAKSEPEESLTDEFYRIFARETPEALQWAFQAWREQSPFFPAISDIRALLKDWHRGVRERLELERAMEEKFLLEERRRQGQLIDYRDVLQKLKEVCQLDSEPMKREKAYQDRLGMKHISLAGAGLHMTEEQIEARRKKEAEEIRHYRKLEDQQNGFYE